jgi:two-component system sensor kinase FixL
MQKDIHSLSFLKGRGIIAAFVLAILLLGGISWLLIDDARNVTETANWVTHTYEVIGGIEIVRSRLADAESAERGHIITGDQDYLEAYKDAIAALSPEVKRIIDLTADNPTQNDRAILLESLVLDRLATLAEAVKLRNQQGFKSAQDFVLSGRGKEQMDKIRTLAVEMDGVERSLLKQRTDASQASTNSTLKMFSIGLLASFVLLLMVFWMLRRQITVRRLAEEALTAALEKERVLLQSAVDVICTIDVEGRFASVNPASKKMWGYSPEELIGRQYGDFIVAEDIARSNEAAVKIMAGETLTNFENRYAHKDGSQVHVMWSATWSNDQQLMFCVAHDITERKKAEEQLQKFAVELERSNSELQDFAAVASHDLQEPLRKIQSFADELKTNIGGDIGDDNLDTLERMIAAAGRMRTLINDLLAFSRVTTQAKPFVPVNLETTVNEVLSDLEARMRDTGGNIEVGSLPTIDADAMQMRQLFQNLIGNSLKFHRPGIAPAIKISGTNGGRNLQLTIRDNGIGFDEKYLDRIFTVFQRLHGRNEFEGTGIGLAICRKIVERHGGEITANSSPGNGATFTITLPTKQLQEAKL